MATKKTNSSTTDAPAPTTEATSKFWLHNKVIPGIVASRNGSEPDETVFGRIHAAHAVKPEAEYVGVTVSRTELEALRDFAFAQANIAEKTEATRAWKATYRKLEKMVGPSAETAVAAPFAAPVETPTPVEAPIPVEATPEPVPVEA